MFHLLQVKPALLKVLHKVPGVDLQQTEFTYEEVHKCAAYVLNYSRLIITNIKEAIFKRLELFLA